MSSTLFLKGDTYLHHIPLFKFIKQLQSFNPASVADSLISCDIMERCAITKAGNWVLNQDQIWNTREMRTTQWGWASHSIGKMFSPVHMIVPTSIVQQNILVSVISHHFHPLLYLKAKTLFLCFSTIYRIIDITRNITCVFLDCQWSHYRFSAYPMQQLSEKMIIRTPVPRNYNILIC